jgi:hypothetical protein
MYRPQVGTLIRYEFRLVYTNGKLLISSVNKRDYASGSK